MSKINVRAQAPDVRTAEGAPAYPHLKPIEALRRSALSCLLWENEFYEDGKAIAERISELAKKVSTAELANLAREARTVHNLRHVPLLLLVELTYRQGREVGDAIHDVIQRADELAELMAIYWKDGRHPLSRQLKIGLARAFRKFNAYSLAKYNRDSEIKLRDVLFMVHGKPREAEGDAQFRNEQAVERKNYRRGEVRRHDDSLYAQLINDELPTPDTWEAALSSGADKKAAWERLLTEKKLGYLALLRNLRNMTSVGVSGDLIIEAIVARRGAERVLPFRYIAAARACPQLEPALDTALLATIEGMPKFTGKTVVLVDVSDSMNDELSEKSDLKRMDAAAALGAMIPGEVRLFSFSTHLVEVPPRRGMAGVDAIIRSQPHSNTRLADAVHKVNESVPHDRLIVITDEQATDGRIPAPVAPLAYMINVASNRNGVGYGKWIHLDGFSEGVLRWILAAESGLLKE